MRKLTIALVVLLTLASTASWAAERMPPVLVRDAVMLDGVTGGIRFGNPPAVALLSTRTPITGFAFGPGRQEIAYCGPAQEGGRSALWVVGAWLSQRDRDAQGGASPDGPPFTSGDRRQFRPPPAPPRLVWTAPEGATLRGPIWWAPNGAQLAVRAFRGEQCELVSVDYATGETTTLAQGAITAAAWAPDGKHLAYVKDSDATLAVWLQSFPPAQERKLDEGGLDLRWAVAGTAAYWIATQPGDTWTKRIWSAEADKVEVVGQVPARPEGTIWSPDGRLCAVVVEDKLVIYPAGSTRGEAVALEGVYPQRVLCWTPDSRIVLMLADRNLPVAETATPETGLPDYIRTEMEKAGLSYESLRASVAGPPLNSESGPPSWSSSADMLAYVFSCGEANAFVRWQRAEMQPAALDQFIKDAHVGPAPAGKEGLIAVSLLRRAFPRAEVEEQPGSERLKVRVLSNIKNIATALVMYLSDYNAFPEALTGEELREIIRDYLKSDEVFCLPDSDEVVVQYLIPPGTKLADIEDAGITPMVVVEAVPGWDIVGFVDGHAKAYPKDAPPEAWRQYLLPPKRL